MVEIAKANAQAAGFLRISTLSRCACRICEQIRLMELLFESNSYGERHQMTVSNKAHAEMGETAPLKNLSKFILTSDKAFESKHGSQVIKMKIYNGTLKADYINILVNE